MEGGFAGYVTVNWLPDYPPFREAGVMEIQDLNVLPCFRRQGIAPRLVDRAVREASRRSKVVGVGAGLSRDYGPAQRLCVLRGYGPEGRGPSKDAPHGASAKANHDLALYLITGLLDDTPPHRR